MLASYRVRPMADLGLGLGLGLSVLGMSET